MRMAQILAYSVYHATQWGHALSEYAWDTGIHIPPIILVPECLSQGNILSNWGWLSLCNDMWGQQSVTWAQWWEQKVLSTEKWQNMPPQNMLLLYKDYFLLKGTWNWKVWERHSDLPGEWEIKLLCEHCPPYISGGKKNPYHHRLRMRGVSTDFIKITHFLLVSQNI